MMLTRSLAGVALVVGTIGACGGEEQTATTGSTEQVVTEPAGEPATDGPATSDSMDNGMAPDPTDAATEVTEPSQTEPVGSQPPATQPPATQPPATTEPPGPAPGHADLGFTDCEQLAIVAKVDPAAARTIVPSQHEVLEDNEGLATFTHVSKTCSDIMVDGVSMGPGQFDTQWITIAGPEDQRAYPDHPDHFVLPTDYLYPINFSTGNPEYQAAVAEFGTPIRLAEAIEMERLGAGPQAGSLTLADDGYHWAVDNVDASEMAVYFVHILRHEDNTYSFEYDIECPSTLRWNAGPSLLEPTVGSPLHGAFGDTITGLGYGVELNCTISIDRSL